MDKVKVVNMFKDNIKWVVDKGSGFGVENYEEVIYEGYGFGGIVVLVYVLIDNKNWIVVVVCLVFMYYGGVLVVIGVVSYMFDCKGYIVISCEDLDIDEDMMLMDVLDVGGDDL